MFPKWPQGAPESDEETPLLPDVHPLRKETSLLVVQILLLLLLQLSEPITSFSIKLYVNELVCELPVTGGDEKKVGYYAELIAATVLYWSRLFDKVGLKPVLLCGLLGTMVSSLLGLSRSFWALVLSRCLNGMLNGNVGVMKSMMAELTDETNMARGSSLIPVIWAAGGTIGPFIGGVLSPPQDRWPILFWHPFWGRYPCFLPCFAAAAYALTSFFLAAKGPVLAPNTEAHSRPPQVREEEISDEAAKKDTWKPLPLCSLIRRPEVLVSVANYGMIALVPGRALAPNFF